MNHLPSKRPARHAALALLGVALLALGGCATTQQQPYDYGAYKQSRPASLLVLPPVNDSPDVKAGYSVLAQATGPLAEAGYYVVPVSLVEETLRENGVTTPDDAQSLDAKKLREVFGADAAVYLRVKQYGSRYYVVGSQVTVEVEGRIVDLRSGQQLWDGTATAVHSPQQSGGGIVGLLVTAIVNQIAHELSDTSHATAGIADQLLLAGGRPRGVLWGPRSPNFGKD